MSTHPLTRRVALAATLAVTATAGTAALPATHTTGLFPGQALAACQKARIGGSTKCLQPGEFCARAYASSYKRYGFTCARGSDGRYRLRYS